MVGFLIATHGGFARGILDSIELIAGKQERIDTISILHETSIDVFRKRTHLIKSSSWMMVTVWSYSVICCWQVLITRQQ